MAILSALLSLVLRQLSTILQAIFGWSITALFGKLPSRKQLALSVSLALSIFWPLLVLGCFLPGVAAWMIAFVPMHKWLGNTALRILWIALAVIVPLGVGGLTRWITPKDQLRGRLAFTLLGGYVLALAYFLAFMITALTVPVVKVLSAARRWEDCHVYLQSKQGRYFAVLDALALACERAGAHVVREDVPWPMALASSIVQALSRPFLVPIVATKPQRLRGAGLEIYLYPADLLLRGPPPSVAHVRAAMTRTHLEEGAYLVTDPAAQSLEDEIQALFHEFKDCAHARANEASERLKGLSKRLDRARLSFDDWTILEAALQRFARMLSGQADLLEAGSDDDKSGAVARPTSGPEGPKARRAHAAT